jgi:hypothetical protein
MTAFVGSKAESLGDPWPKSFEEDVCPVDESAHHVAVADVLQIGGDERPSAQLRAAATSWPLHADHVGSEVGEQHSGVRTRTHPGQFDDLHAAQRTSRRWRGAIFHAAQSNGDLTLMYIWYWYFSGVFIAMLDFI